MPFALVVDDDPVLLRVMASALRRNGWTVSTAPDTNGAMAALRETPTPFDVAVVDYDLAREDGIALLTRFRDVAPHCIRVLATGRHDVPVEELVNAGEVTRILRKPFNAESLLAMIQDALTSVEMKREMARLDKDRTWQDERVAVDAVLEGCLMHLVVQPIVRVVGGAPQIMAVECLLRPRHAAFPNVTAFLAAVEAHGRVPSLGRAVALMASELFVEMDDDIRLFVNLHPAQLSDPERLRMDLAPLIPHASQTCLELTERVPIHEIANWRESLAMARGLGFHWVVDDLGAGANGLTMLADVHPSIVKLDMRLVRGVESDPRRLEILRFVARLGKSMGFEVVAEGVETREECAAVADCGIEVMQGWLFGRETPVGAMRRYV